MHEHHHEHADRTHEPAREAGRPEQAPGSRLGPMAEGLLALQRDAGNRAVAAQLAQRRALGDGVAAATAGSGTSLPGPLRTALESHVGADLSGVRVHSGGAAAASARALSAEAYTVGNDIVVGQGMGTLSSREGQHRIAHEVTHVVQQRNGPVSATDTGGGVAVSDPGDAFERAAEQSATAFTSGHHRR